MAFGIVARLVVVLLLVAAVPVRGEEVKESLYSQINRTVIRLEHYETVSQEGSKVATRRNVPDGTAFFVASGSNLFLVTARHVVDKPHSLHARVQCRNNRSGEKKVVMLRLPAGKWTFHSEGGDKGTAAVDVAVMKLFVPREWSVVHFRYEPDESSPPNRDQLPAEDAEPPAPILVFGFPANIGFELAEQNPLVRFGVVSLKAGKKFIKLGTGKYVEERASLLDARVFGGNSGSPVMNQVSPGTSEPKLLGLVIASSKNLDFAIMEPVSRIRETLDLAKDREHAGVWEEIKGKGELAADRDIPDSDDELK